MTQPRLTEVLTRIADQATPASIAPDTWHRGVRRRRARIVAAGLTAVAVLAAVPLLLLDRDGTRHVAPASPPRPVVPSRVYPPVTGEDTIVESPPGPAAIIVSGDRELRGSDIWGWEGRSLLVGQDGGYRLARTVGEASAGLGDLLLSPDGRFLASVSWLEGAPPSSTGGGTVVFDLTTGKAREFRGGQPLAWSPDGGSILLRDIPPGGGNPPGELGGLRLLDLSTGDTRALPRIEGRMREGNLVAFSPDGARLAVAMLDELYVIDLAEGRLNSLAGLSIRDRLAGPGAWLPDGNRIAVYTMTGCTEDDDCDEAELARRQFRIRYLDAGTGRPATGPALAAARGMAVRLFGWRADGSAVAAVYSPENGTRTTDSIWSETDWYAVGGVALRAFGTDGSQRVLVDLPESALFTDVPAGLLDRFGGPSPSRLEGGVRRLLAVYWPLGQIGEALVLLVLLIVGFRQRHRLTRRRRPTAG